GQRFGIPLYGTMAHSYVQAHESEEEAFAAFARARPEGLVLLIDTYDVETAVRRVIELDRALKASGRPGVSAVRLDSGDLAAGARRIRRMLDAGGSPDVGVFLSGNLDEHKIRRIVAGDVPAAGFGVGTNLDTSGDAPSIDFAYKLQSYEGSPRRKRSPGKATWPCAKQVWRRTGPDGRLAGDRIAPADEAPAAGQGRPLLVPVMDKWRSCDEALSLETARARAAGALASLPAALRSMEPAGQYPVEISPALQRLAEAADAAVS
ncbi:MAG: nicotinate phosphoribosyltransferase, partial [Gammaproteobacteria bacterium]